MKTSSPSSAAEAIPVEAVTMGTDWDAMLSPLSEGRDSVKTVTVRDRDNRRQHEAAFVPKLNAYKKKVCVCACVCVSHLVQPLVKVWWGHSFLLHLHHEQLEREETRTSPDLHKQQL